MAFGNLCSESGLYSYTNVKSEHYQDHVFLAVAMVLFVAVVLLPGLVLWDVAALSTDCDTLYDSLN
eukprot:COSAG01_NODE_59916_length_297_cov_1.060606_1_plen_65_part_10